MEPTTYIIIAAVALVILGILLAPVFSRRKHTYDLRSKFGAEYDNVVQTTGDEKKAQSILEEREKRVKSLEIRPLTPEDRERYLTDWAEVQSKFVDEPGKAIQDADRLIMEVMQLRAFPLSDFEQRAADISVLYPHLVGNYREAKAIALRNEQEMTDTEELRQAMIYYRSLFEELVGKEEVMKEEISK